MGKAKPHSLCVWHRQTYLGGAPFTPQSRDLDLRRCMFMCGNSSLVGGSVKCARERKLGKLYFSTCWTHALQAKKKRENSFRSERCVCVLWKLRLLCFLSVNKANIKISRCKGRKPNTCEITHAFTQAFFFGKLQFVLCNKVTAVYLYCSYFFINCLRNCACLIICFNVSVSFLLRTAINILLNGFGLHRWYRLTRSHSTQGCRKNLNQVPYITVPNWVSRVLVVPGR